MRRTLTKIAAAVALLAPVAAHADPVTLITMATLATIAVDVALVALPYLLVASNIYGGMDARRRARNAQGDARRAYNASLSDRSITAVRDTPSWRVVYGEAITGGDVVAILTSDKATVGADGTATVKPDGLKHLVIAFASHEVEALGEVFVAGVSAGALDGAGWSTDANWTTGQATRTASVTFTDSVTLTNAALSIVSASSTITGVGDAGSETISRTVAISGGGLTISITDGMTGTPLTVVYTVALSPAVIRISKHLGSDSQTVDTYLTGVCPTEWDNSHRLRGVAYLVVTLDLEDSRFQGGPPPITCRVKGRKLYDPRKDSTNGGSGAHRSATPSTWEWSDNPALCVRDFIVAEYGMQCGDADVIDASTAAAANACDVAITTDTGGVTASDVTYRCNGGFTTANGREATLDALCDSMAGFAPYGAQYRILAGAWSAPVMPLTDDDLDGQIEIVQAGAGIDELFNGVRGTYIAADASSPTDFEPYSNAAFVTADGEELWQDTALPFTNSKPHCSNIARVMTERARNSLVIRYPAKLLAWPLQVGDRVTATSAEYGYSVKTFRVTDWSFSLAGSVDLLLQEDAAAAYDLVDAVDADPTPNTNLPLPWIVEAVSLNPPESGTEHLMRSSDGTILSRVWVSWAALTGPYLVDGTGRVVVRWLRTGIDSGWHEVSSDAREPGAYLMGMSDGDVLAIEAYAINSAGFRGALATTSHAVIGKTAPPSDVDAFTIMEGAGFSRAYFWDYSTNTPDLAGFRVRYVDAALSGVPWDAMTPLLEAGRLNRSAASQQPADGEWSIAIKAYDTSGNESINARFLSILLDQGSFGAPLLSIDAGALGWPGTCTGCGPVDYYLADAGSLTWDTIPTAWDSWLDWAGPTASPIVYQHTTVDALAVLTMRLRESHVAAGSVVVEYQRSTDNITFTSWAAIPSGTFSARYLRLRWTISGASPVLYRAHFRVYT